MQAGWQDSSFERGDGGNISRTPDDDLYGGSHTKADVGLAEKDITDNGFYVYESP